MKKGIAVLLLLGVLLSLFGCSWKQKDTVPIQFYYLRGDGQYLYGAADGVVTFEEREQNGHVGDFRYLLMLYLQGPLDEMLESPFPAGCGVLELTRTTTEMLVTLNSKFLSLTGMERTLACVCLARTCFSMASVQKVHILAQSEDGKESVHEIITIDSLLLGDGSVASTEGE